MQEMYKGLFSSQDTTANNFFLMAGPCVIESEEVIMKTAEKVVAVCAKFKIPLNKRLKVVIL